MDPVDVFIKCFHDDATMAKAAIEAEAARAAAEATKILDSSHPVRTPARLLDLIESHKYTPSITRVVIPKPAEIRPRRHLIFDTEYESGRGVPAGQKWKRDVLLQLSYAVVEVLDVVTDRGEFYDFYINCPEIEQGFLHRTTGITKELLEEKGKSIREVMETFMRHARECECLVAFNYNADQHHVINELLRLGRTEDAQYMLTCKSLCLMQNTKDIVCATNSNGNPKLPSLAELYAHYHNGATFENAHNARADVDATWACYRAYSNRR